MRLPDRVAIEYDDYAIKHFVGNKGIYDNFSDIQFKVIQEYFKWRTRREFKRIAHGTVLQTKPNKSLKLLQIVGDAKDWEYNGCVDTGYAGGGVCELGHRLRYEHYAYSPSQEREVIFGITCASDFFELDKDVLTKISKLQEYTLEDIKMISFLVGTDKFVWYMQEYCGDLFDMINFFGDRLGTVFPYGWNEMMASFLKVGLPFTTPMVNMIERVRAKEYREGLEETAQLVLLREIIPDLDNNLLNLLSGSDIYVANMTRKYILNKKDRSDIHIKKSRYLVNVVKGISKVKDSKLSNIVDVAENSVIHRVYVNAKNGKRLATKKEAELFFREQLDEQIELVDKEKVKYLNALAWAIKGKPVNYAKAGGNVGKNESEFIKLESIVGVLVEAIKWVYTDDFEVTINEINSKLKKYEYLDNAEDEITAGTPFESRWNLVKDAMASLKGRENIPIYLEICNNMIEDKVNPNDMSNRQRDMVDKAYKYLTSVDEDDMIDSAIELLNTNTSIVKKARIEFHIKIAESVVKYGKCSDKQAKIVNEGLEKLEAYRKKNGINKESTGKKKEAISAVEVTATEVGDSSANLSGIDRTKIEKGVDTLGLGDTIKYERGIPSLTNIYKGLSIGLYSDKGGGLGE